MGKISVYYGSTTGNTRNAAEKIATLLGNGVQAVDVGSARKDSFADSDVLILGTSTWGVGELQDDWIGALDHLRNAPLRGKHVALFGLGDQSTFADSFVDGMRDIYDAACEAGATPVGACPQRGYEFNESRAVVEDLFVGLPLDDDNQSEMTNSRILMWVRQLETELGLKA